VVGSAAVLGLFNPGEHGSTFGGNPLATAVGAAVLDAVLEPGFLDTVLQRANRLAQGLAQLKDEFPDIVADVRGKGLLAGIKVAPPVGDVVKAVIAEKLLAVGAGENVMRVLPPLNVSDAEIGEGLARMRRAFQRLSIKS